MNAIANKVNIGQYVKTIML